ncbi:hypothetical protein P8452_50742 [Trifolium repens]|nr:hypothetical protein P8452_50742 [Trifolium repens]
MKFVYIIIYFLSLVLVATSVVDIDCERDSDCFDVKCKLPERPWCTQYNRCECLPPDEAECFDDSHCKHVKCKRPWVPRCNERQFCKCLDSKGRGF